MKLRERIKAWRLKLDHRRKRAKAVPVIALLRIAVWILSLFLGGKR